MKRSKLWSAAAGVAVALAVVVAAGGGRYGLSPVQLLSEAARTVAARVLAVAYVADMRWVHETALSYWHGEPPAKGVRRKADPFIYENPDAPHLAKMRDVFHLEEVIRDAPGEYAAILRLAGWVGSQFDHGTDPVAGGDKGCDPVALIVEGRAGKKYWCEIAARLMVHAAAALGLPARIITASTDGYTWEHAVAEIWSNEFQKWILVDTDFNLVFESGGIPQSATDLMADGEALSAKGLLDRRRIAPPKKSLDADADPLYLYRYIHVDLRNDWCSRTLRRGSPAGGDLATRWMADESIPPILTARVHLQSADLFNPVLNTVEAKRVESESGPQVTLTTFSPYFEGFEAQTADGNWQHIGGSRFALAQAATWVAVRTATRGGWKGPASDVRSLVTKGISVTP